MALPQAIQKRGFRKWYERELLVGHSHLVLLLLCTLALLGAFEASRQPAAAHGLLVVCAGVAAGVGLWSLRRYLFRLTRAEFIASQAVCTQCQAYGRWTVEADAPACETEGTSAQMRVCCRGCGGRWLIEW